MTPVEQLIKELQEFAERLDRGESIECTTVRKCNHPNMRTGDAVCRDCGNKGYVRTRTMLGPRE